MTQMGNHLAERLPKQVLLRFGLDILRQIAVGNGFGNSDHLFQVCDKTAESVSYLSHLIVTMDRNVLLYIPERQSPARGREFAKGALHPVRQHSPGYDPDNERDTGDNQQQ